MKIKFENKEERAMVVKALSTSLCCPEDLNLRDNAPPTLDCKDCEGCWDSVLPEMEEKYEDH